MVDDDVVVMLTTGIAKYILHNEDMFGAEEKKVRVKGLVDACYFRAKTLVLACRPHRAAKVSE